MTPEAVSRELAQPHVVYAVAVVKASKHRGASYRFVTALTFRSVSLVHEARRDLDPPHHSVPAA